MKGFLKKMTAFFTAFAMILTIAGFQPMDVKAAGTEITGGSIKVTGVMEAGTTIKAYRIMKVTLDGKNNLSCEWDASVKSWIDTNYPAYSEPTDFTGLDASAAKSFYTKLAAAINAGTVSVTAKETTADGSKTDTVTGLSAGLYLVLAEGGTDYRYNAMAVSLLPKAADGNVGYAAAFEGPAELAAKPVGGPTKTITNTTETADGVNIGDTVSWLTSYGVPTYADDATNLEYYIYDILPKSLALKEGAAIVVKGVDEEGHETTLTLGNEYSAVDSIPGMTAPLTDNKSWAFRYSFDITKIKSYKTITVSYDTVITKLAEVNNPNENETGVVHTDPTNPGSYVNSNTKEPEPLTYGAKITKKDGADGSVLSGAVFSVKKAGATDSIVFVEESEGVYRKAEAGETGVTELTVGSTGAQKGILVFKGVELGTYKLTEITAPYGYSKPAADFDVEITKALVEANNGYALKDIENVKFLLPSTGGMGTILFSVLGILLMAAGFVMFQRSKKNRA